MRLPPLLLLYTAAHALLYCSLLPLWEGYDEPFHYGYVQYLIRHGEPPVLDRSPVSLEVWESMRLAPSSYLNARNMPGLTSYADFARLSEDERNRRRTRLSSLPPELRDAERGPDNYEAQQPPLAYLPLIPLELAASGAPLPYRIWLLRLLAAAASLALLLWAVSALGRDAGIPAPYVAAAAFVLVSTQNLYGAVAHVATDWLAVPMFPISMLMAAQLWRNRDVRTAALLALALSAGLLSKSYFLVFVPFAFPIALRAGRKPAAMFCAIVAAAAAPWYIRNGLLYGNLTGLQSAVRDIPAAAVLQSFLDIPWRTAVPGMMRGALWTANSSFTTFSAFTLNLVVLALIAGYVLRLRTIRSNPPAPAEVSILAGTAIFTPVLLYALALFGVLFRSPAPNANAWYSAGLLPGAVLLSFSGFARHTAGPWTARAVMALATYIVAATYFAKLIPTYAGFEGSMHFPDLIALYGPGFEELGRRLSYVTPVNSVLVVGLAIVTVVLAVGSCIRLSSELTR